MTDEQDQVKHGDRAQGCAEDQAAEMGSFRVGAVAPAKELHLSDKGSAVDYTRKALARNGLPPLDELQRPMYKEPLPIVDPLVVAHETAESLRRGIHADSDVTKKADSGGNGPVVFFVVIVIVITLVCAAIVAMLFQYAIQSRDPVDQPGVWVESGNYTVTDSTGVVYMVDFGFLEDHKLDWRRGRILLSVGQREEAKRNAMESRKGQGKAAVENQEGGGPAKGNGGQ